MELVSKKHFASLSGVSPASVSKAIKAKRVRVVGQGRTAKIDIHDAVNIDYMNDNSSNRQVRKRLKAEAEGLTTEEYDKKNKVEAPEDNTGGSVQIRDEKMRLQAKKLEMELGEKMGTLVPRKMVEDFSNKLSGSIVSYLFPISDRAIPLLGGVFECTDQDQLNAAKQIIDSEIGRGLDQVKKEITEWIEGL